MRKIILLTCLGLVLSVFKGLAQDSTSAGALTISGYVDAYYMYNFNKPLHSNGFANQNPGRIFDIKHNQFALGLAQTKFSYTKGRLTGVVDLTFGPNAELGNFGNIYGTMFAIKQAYMDYNFSEKLKFTVGQFGTHVGYELIDAPLNFNHSLSYLFGNGPFYHTGAKLSYTFSDKFGVMAGIVNGWDELWDFNKGKAAIAQVYIAPVDGWNVYVNYIGGDEKNGLSFPTIGSPSGQIADSLKTPSHLFDLTTTYQVTDAFKIGLNAAYGIGRLDSNAAAIKGLKYGNTSWYGAALYLNYSISDNFALGLRAEHFNDKDGVRYVSNALGAGTFNEFTLTGDIKFADGMFNIKPEVRIDVAQKDVFAKYNTDGVFTKMSKVQPTVGSAFIFKF